MSQSSTYAEEYAALFTDEPAAVRFELEMICILMAMDRDDRTVAVDEKSPAYWAWLGDQARAVLEVDGAL